MPKSGSKSVSGTMSKPLSRLWAVFLFLVTFVSTAAHAPGQILLSGHNGPGPTHKARVPAAHGASGVAATIDGDEDRYAILNRWENDAEGAYYSAWNEFDSGTVEFQNPMPAASGYGSARAWDAFPPNSLLAFNRADHEALARGSYRDLNPSLAGGARGAGGSKASGKAPDAPVAPTPGATQTSDSGTAPDEPKHTTPTDTTPTDTTPTDTNPPTDTPTVAKTPDPTPPDTIPHVPSPPDNDSPPTQREPVSVPEPATFALFALSLGGMVLARRRTPPARRA